MNDLPDYLKAVDDAFAKAVADVEARGQKARVAYYEGKVYVIAFDDYEFNRAEVER